MPVTNEPPTGPHRQDQPRFSATRTIAGTLSPALPFWASQAICVSSYGGSSDCCLHPLPIHILDPGEPDGAEEEAAATAPLGADQRRGRRRRAMARKGPGRVSSQPRSGQRTTPASQNAHRMHAPRRRGKTVVLTDKRMSFGTSPKLKVNMVVVSGCMAALETNVRMRYIHCLEQMWFDEYLSNSGVIGQDL